MKYLYFLVEGQTEQRFVSDILQPHLGQSCFCIPVIVKTRREVSGQAYKGGYVPYLQWRDQIFKLLGNSAAHAVTTIADYYRIADDFPAKQAARSLQSPLLQVQTIEQAWAQDINDPRFIPYLSLYELEALLFADVSILVQRLQAIQSRATAAQLTKHAKVNPEDINDQSPPSHLIASVCPRYQKVLHTNQIVQAIGLPTIRARCPHFNDWLTKLESVCALPQDS
ncbi:MAG: DUF4276 family protein [Fimbriimonadales bacterium]|nr:DUF4276 family protein [Fimbriimonadales bacterium]